MCFLQDGKILVEIYFNDWYHLALFCPAANISL
jgi:hypothetical protein